MRSVTARIALGALCLALAAAPWWRALGKDHHADFDQYWYGGLVERTGSYTDTEELLRRADEDGARPTRDAVYGPPTLIALVFVPISFVPLDAAARIYLVAALVLLLYAISRAAPPPWPVWFLGLTLLPSMLFAMALGQASLVTTGLLLLAYAAARDGHETRAGLLIGLATVWKLYPAFLLIVVVAHRRWRALATAGITMAVAGALTAAILGPSGTVEAVERTLELDGLVGRYRQNVSVPGVLARAFDADWPLRWISAALLVTGAWWMFRLARRSGARFHETAALGVVVMLAAQSITWSHYVGAVVVMAFALVASGPVQLGSGGLVLAAVVLLAWPVDRASLPIEMGWRALATAYETGAMVALAIAGALAFIRPDRTHVQEAEKPVR